MNESKSGQERSALERILHTPQLARLVPHLRPELLHRVIEAYGLENCSELVALATPEQLTGILDLDLWRAARPGRNESFDAGRFGAWLEMLADADPARAAQTLAAIDVDLVTAGLVQHVRVFDHAALAYYMTTDGDLISRVRPDDGLSADIAGFVVTSKRTDAWDAIVSVLRVLAAECPEYFSKLMAGTRSRSNSGREIDGLDDLLAVDEQLMFDAAIDRERRRERQGYVAAGDARAFLQKAREVSIGRSTTPLADPIARAHFRALDRVAADSADQGARTGPGPDAVALLLEAGMVEPRAQALLAGPQTQAPCLTWIRDQMSCLLDCDAVAYAARNEEIAFLANTLVAGCSIQARPFTPQEAWDAAVAVCNLGLETLGVSDGYLLERDLIAVFQTGWTVLHDDVAMYAAERLTRVLAQVRCRDREIQAGLNDLRHELIRHLRGGMPWRAREAMDVLASLDMPAWAALLALIDECPTLHAAFGASKDPKQRSVNASAFEFISERAQIRAVQAFMESLSETLRD